MLAKRLAAREKRKQGGYVGWYTLHRRGASILPAAQAIYHVCDGRDAERAYRKRRRGCARQWIEVEVFRPAGTYAGYRFVVGAMKTVASATAGLLAFRTACYACEEPIPCQ
ncbi:MAG: hypothetical protein ACLT98_12905 [Eggerthellaceae bacterium]